MYIQKFNKIYNNQPKIIIFTGAGLSAESGISTFRGKDGLWENHNIDEICNDDTWKRNFNLVHDFYNERRAKLKEVEPNEAHKTIKRIKDKYKEDCIIITQNVDNLLERSGIDKEDVMHLHGNLEEMECTACGNKWEIGTENFDIKNDRCPKCGSLKGVKPNIVFFNGVAPLYKYLYRALDYLENKDSLLIVIGTSSKVVNISQLTNKIDKKKKILNNLEKEIPDENGNLTINENNFEHIFYENASTALPKIEKIIEEKYI